MIIQDGLSLNFRDIIMYRLRVFYRKENVARFISEKNFQRMLERTLRRMDVPMKFTEGFNPHPKMSFGPPLPVGIAGLNERFDVFLIKKIDINSFISQSRDILPEGIVFSHTKWIENTAPSIHSIDTFAKYIIETTENTATESLEKMGKITEHTDKRIALLIRVNNFSHKELTGLLLKGEIKNITREIL